MTRKIDTQKNELRKQILRERGLLTTSEKKSSDKAIHKLLQSQQLITDAQSIFCYISTKEEIDTTFLINSWVKQGKNILIPKVEKNRKLTLHQFKHWNKLSNSSYNILEPTSNENKIDNITDIDLVIVPCLGSDYTCHRLGYGGGFYDTFISKSSAISIALCRDCFLFDKIPFESHDKTVDSIISETQIIHKKDHVTRK